MDALDNAGTSQRILPNRKVSKSGTSECPAMKTEAKLSSYHIFIFQLNSKMASHVFLPYYLILLQDFPAMEIFFTFFSG
jgi:hypothetical protein